LYTEPAVPHENRGILIEDRVMVPRSALDHSGYRAWVKSDEYPERLRTTFVAGEVLVEMTPESLEKHSQVKLTMTTALATFVAARDLGRVYPDRSLVTNEEAGLSCEPDLMFIAWDTLEQGRIRFVKRATGDDYIELVGSPDLVVEIVSDSSVRKDTSLLLNAYFAAGVREYWLVDARGDEIRFDILRRGPEGFLPRSAKLTVPQTSDVLVGAWSLTRARGRLGLFTYTLTAASRS
jgi:Uma2 family endonuclease